MKKLILVLMLLNCALIFGMEEEPCLRNGQLTDDTIADLKVELEVPENVMMYLYDLAKESDLPEEKFEALKNMVFAEVKKQKSFNLSIDAVMNCVYMLEFSSPIELLKFLYTFASLNKSLRATIKPNIVYIIKKKFNIPENLTKTFLKLVKGKRGIPISYLEKLLLDFEKQQQIKVLRKTAKADLNQAIKNLEQAVYNAEREKAMDHVISLPKEIHESDVGNLLKYLIDNDDEDFLRMFISAGINLDASVIKFATIKYYLFPWMDYITYPVSALVYAIFYKKTKIVSLLIKYGAKVNFIDQIGFSPLDFALRFDLEDIIVLLENNGADIGPAYYGSSSKRGKTFLAKNSNSRLHKNT